MKKNKLVYGTREYFDNLYTIYNEPWEFSRRGTQILRYKNYLRMISFKTFDKVLDIGCSQGQFTEKIFSVSRKVVGLDICMTAIERAKRSIKKKNVDFVVGSLPKLNFRNKEFDLVLALEVICYLNEKEKKEALKEIKRVLSRGGYFLLSSSIGNKPYFKIDELEKFVKDGFVVIERKYYYGKLYDLIEKKLLILEDIFKNSDLGLKLIRKILENIALVEACSFITKVFLGYRGVTIMTMLVKKNE